MDQRSFELVPSGPLKLARPDVEDAVSFINRALHREGVSGVRVDRLRCADACRLSDACRLLGVTTPTSTLQGLLEHRDAVLKAARMIDSRISDIVPQQKWKWVKIHNVPLDRYMGRREVGVCSSPGRSWRRRTVGLASPQRLGGGAGRESGPGPRERRAARLRWWPQF